MRRARGLLALALLSLSGCGTMINLGMGDIGDPRGTMAIYGAVRWDVDRIGEHPGVLLIMPLEFPISLVCDTLFLPLTIAETLKSGD